MVNIKMTKNNKDWIGNKNSIFKTLGASNHTEKERQSEDYYATDPIAIDVLIKDGRVTFDKPVWECACGEMIERMFPNCNKLELFARNTREGWDSWGNEIG